jgi:hypothetical protein
VVVVAEIGWTACFGESELDVVLGAPGVEGGELGVVKARSYSPATIASIAGSGTEICQQMGSLGSLQPRDAA